MEVYLPHIPTNIADGLLSFAQKADFVNGYKDGYDRDADFRKPRKGGTSLYLPYDDNVGVLYSLAFKNNVSVDEFKETIDEIWNMYEGGAKVSPILGYVRGKDGKGVPNEHYTPDNNVGYRDVIFVQRAPGHKLNDTSSKKRWYYKTQERLKGPISHYDEVTDTFMEIMDSRVRPDISANNIIHHPQAGFNFIDFNKLQGDKPYTYLPENTARFLQSFVLRKGFPNGDIKRLYLKDAKQEQQILTSLLHDKGVKQDHLDYAISKIEDLDCKSMDDLFK